MAGVEFYSGMLVPAFVNSHCHLELSHMSGAIPEGGGFVGFARGMAANRDLCSEEQRLRAIAAADASMWHQGIAAVADVSNSAATFSVKAQSHIRYHTFLELFGLGSDLESLRSTAHEAVAMGLSFSTTPHSVYLVEDDAFRRAVKGFGAEESPGNGKCAGNAGTNRPPLSIHFMESAGEGDLFRCRGEMWEWLAERGQKPEFAGRYASPADRLVALVPSDRNVMLIHDCLVTEEDIDKIMSHFTARVTWVLCPHSNRYITGLRPPVELLRRKGLNVAIGTDSLASNHSLDMVAELHELSGVPLADLLHWATLGGATALGYDTFLGSFERGKHPGVALLTGVDWDKMSLTPNARLKRIL
jgi:cytosine/adenosine deaminase-related metal-dependent hydrolase